MAHNSSLDHLGPVSDLYASVMSPACVAPVCAVGAMQLLLEHCWEHYTDVVGDGDDIERMCKWPGIPGMFTRAMVKAGLVRLLGKGQYYCPVAVAEAPEHMKKRWRRVSRDTFNTASQRAKKPPDLDEPSHEPDTLWGDPLPEKPKDKNYHGFVRHWFERWQAVYGGRYPFFGKDGAHVKALLKHCGTLAKACDAADRYLATTDKWYTGHPLQRLIGDLPKFVAQARGTVGEARYRSEGADTALGRKRGATRGKGGKVPPGGRGAEAPRAS